MSDTLSYNNYNMSAGTLYAADTLKNLYPHQEQHPVYLHQHCRFRRVLQRYELLRARDNIMNKG